MTRWEAVVLMYACGAQVWELSAWWGLTEHTVKTMIRDWRKRAIKRGAPLSVGTKIGLQMEFEHTYMKASTAA